MIENLSEREKRERMLSRRKGVTPSASLRRHFVALARQVSVWWRTQPSHADRGLRIGVTSLTGGAGRSTVSFNLAASMASLMRCRTLLVESDFGKHYVTRRLGYARSHGLSELILGLADSHEIIHPTPVPSLSVMGCGQKLDQDALELPFDSLPGLLDRHASEFGGTVFDLPMANHLTTFHSIVPHLDGVLLTVESKQIDHNQITRFRRQMESLGVEIVGLVLNKS